MSKMLRNFCNHPVASILAILLVVMIVYSIVGCTEPSCIVDSFSSDIEIAEVIEE